VTVVTSTLERVPLHRIRAEAKPVDPARFGRFLLTVLAGVLYLLGWVCARVLYGLGWIATAVRVGWVEGRRRPAGDG
jgi:hypothetical protein